LQLLWLNMLTDVVPALALASEPAEPHVMDRPPRDPRAQLFGGADYLRLGRASARMAAAALAAWLLGAARRGRGAEPRAMAFTALASAQILHTFARRAGGARGANPVLVQSLAATAAVQLAALSSRTLRGVLSIGRTSATDLALATLAGALPAGLRWAREHAAVDEIVIERPPRRPQPDTPPGKEPPR
jgi:Ca2+-transporting ATPase